MEEAKAKPKKRRPKGDGSIQRLANGKYKAVITIGDDGSGTQRRKSFTADTQKAVVSMLNEFKAQKSKGTLVAGNNCRMSEYISRWLKAKQSNIRDSSHTLYSHICTKQLMPELGEHKMQKVTTAIINNYLTSKASQLSSATLKKHRQVLSGIFDLAMDEGVVSVNPVSRSSSLRNNTRSMNVLTKEDIKVVLEYSMRLVGDSKPSMQPMYLIIRLALATGLRIGELLALRWKNIGDDSVTVTHSLSAKRKLGLPKSTSSLRKISVDKATVDELREIQRGDWVFQCNKGLPLYPCTVSARFKEIVDDCGIHMIRFHDLRHTHATHLIAEGCNIKMVSERLGHSSVNITLALYVHSIPDQDREAADKIGKLLVLNECL